MSDEQKIWFVYLTDHHEGPFTPEGVGELVATGLVNGQTLGWKDGMAEWVPVETIPELRAAVQAGSSPTSASAASEPFSLAQMLSSQQGDAPVSAPVFESGADALASSAATAFASAPLTAAPVFTPSGGGSDPEPDEDAWAVFLNGQVSGLYPFQRLKLMANEGDLPVDAKLWRRGWTDFQPLSTVPELAAIRRPVRSTYAGNTGTVRRPTGGIQPATAAAHAGNDEPTDTGIQAPPGKGFKGLLQRGQQAIAGMKSKLGSKKEAAAPAKTFGGRGGVPAKFSGGGKADKAKRIGLLVGGIVGIAALGGGAYFFLFSSPFPSDLDVTPDDLAQMTESVKVNSKLYLAPAQGAEGNAADKASPKFYVAAKLPEGKEVRIHLEGKAGTLVNRPTFDKEYHSTMGRNKIATFEKLDDEGKPLPMGEYHVTVSADGATPLSQDRFLGGNKGPVYQDRLKKYQDKVAAESERANQDLHETADTLKSLYADLEKQINEYNSWWGTPQYRPRVSADWKSFETTAKPMLEQLDQKVKSHATGGALPRNYQDVSTTLQQMQQLFGMQGQRMQGVATPANFQDMELSVKAGIAALEPLSAPVAPAASPPAAAAAPSVPAARAAPNSASPVHQ